MTNEQNPEPEPVEFGECEKHGKVPIIIFKGKERCARCVFEELMDESERIVDSMRKELLKAVSKQEEGEEP